MTREQAKSKLIELGIAEPTEEQVSKYLDSVTEETKSEKAKAERYKSDAEKVKDLQAKIDELESGNLSEIEKANKDLETANNRIAELEKKQAIDDQRKSAMEKFKVTSEQAKQIVKEDGTFDYDALGTIISEKETAAANAKEQEIANNSTNPGGGSAGSGTGDENKPADVENAESITFGGASKEAQSARDYYK